MTEDYFFLHQHHSDFDDFCTNALNWDLDYRQLERGAFTSQFLTCGNSQVIFSSAKLGRRMLQRGSSPPGMVTFGLLACPEISIHWRNIDVSGEQLFIFPPGGELHSISQADFYVFVVSLSEEKLNQVCASFELPDLHKLITGHEVFQCAPQGLAQFRHLLLKTGREIRQRTEMTNLDLHMNHLENELAVQLTGLLARNFQPVTRSRPRKRDLALQSAESYIHEAGNKIVTIPELCDACNASQRTLEYAFRERYCLTPKEYTLVYRLNNVRKQLRQAIPEKDQVSRIAQQHGFWHMGQFSSSYRKLFAELPSETLKQYS